MGLDMFLYKKNGEAEEEVAYWRKANAIHAWFVRNVQSGKDECEPHPVTRGQLQSLVNTCKQVLHAPKDRMHVAKQLLPTQSGFFFGGTDYDSYYFEDLESTIQQIEKVLRENADAEFTYVSSW